MIRPNWKCLLTGAVVAIALSSAAPQADAYGWGYYQPASWSSCYTPCYTSCYAPRYTRVSCYSPCYSPCDSSLYLGWRPGPIRRLFFGPYRWYWGGYCGNSCYTSDCDSSCTDCGTTAAPAGAPTPAPAAPTPAAKPVPVPTEPAPAAPAPMEPAAPKTSSTSADQSGVLTVWVPYDAKVSINGMQTRSTGSRRQFVSFGLKPGLTYKYEVKAQIIRNGEVLEDIRTVTMTAGDITAVAFGFNTTGQQVASAQ
jgi:uncharacterized protein (TIGR03000 family)